VIISAQSRLATRAARHARPHPPPDIVDFLEGRTTDRDGRSVPPLQLIDKDNPYRGPFTTENCPDIREILRACVSRTTRKAVIVGPTQSFKTTILIGVEAYTIAVDHGPIGHVLPNESPLARGFSNKRFQPIVDATPWLAALKPSNPDDYKTLELGFTTCTVRFAGSNSPGNLASWPYRRVIGDETDKFPQLIGKSAGTRELLQQRVGQFTAYNIIDASSPTVAWGTIWQAALVGTCERYYVPCPHCSKTFTQRFTTDGTTLVWDKNARHANGTWDLARVAATAHYRCPHCAGEIWENHRRDMLHAGAWRPDPKEEADSRRADYELVADPECRSFFRSCFNVLHPNRTYAAIAVKFLLAGRDRSKLQTFWNDELGEIWEEAGETADADVLYKRREDYLEPDDIDHAGRPLIPEDIRVITASCDVQANPPRVEYEIVGWGAGFESWGLRYGIFEKRGSWQETFAAVDALLLKTWLLPIGHGGYMELQPAAICWDTGHETEEVYKFVRRCQPRRVYAVKGDSEGYGSPLVHRPTKSGVKQVVLHMIGTVTAKLEIVSRLRLAEPGPGYCHFPKNPKHGYDLEYFRQLTAEKAMQRRIGGRMVYKFVPIRKRNEALDIRCYNRGALHILDPNFDKIEAKVKSATAQMELPTAPTDFSHENKTQPNRGENASENGGGHRSDLRSPDGSVQMSDAGRVSANIPEISLDAPITKEALKHAHDHAEGSGVAPDAPAASAPEAPKPNSYELVTGPHPESKPRPEKQKTFRPRRNSWATRW
jgi:phage terminase large subunit GpA-like protein